MRKPELGVVVAVVLLATGACWGQELPPPPPGVSSQLQGLFGGVVSSGEKKTGAPLPSMAFKPTGKLIITDVIIKALTLDKTQEAEMRTFVPQLVGAIEQAYVQNGFTKNDLSVALAGLLTTCHEVNTGTFKLEESSETEKELGKKKLRAVVIQIQRTIGGSPAFAKVADKDKQSAYEMCTFQTGFLAVNWQQAGDDPEKQAAVRQTARQLLTSLFGIDPDGITQSKTGEIVPRPGFVPKKQPSAEPEAAPTPALSASLDGAPALPPAGWGVAAGKSAGSFVFAPNGLAAGETFFVAVGPLQNLNDTAIDAYLTESVAKNPLGLGKTAAPLKVRSTSDNAATAAGALMLAEGKPASVIYIAQTMDRQTVRVCAIVSSRDDLMKPHQPGVQALLASLMQADKKAAVEENRGLSVAKLPIDIPKWLTTGGPLQPGIYTGNEMYGTETRSRLRLYLFPSGEYQLLNSDGGLVSDHSSVNFKYNRRTGLLDLDWGSLHNMSNDKSDPDDDMCLYGKDSQGKSVVYARSDRGFSYSTTLLKYEGPLDRPSPAEEKAKKVAAEAEARRYKWVTAVPGKGIQSAQIQCLLLHTETTQFYNGSGMSISSTYDPYILLKDGTIYNGLPVAPDDIDVSRSRRQEPEKWGRWKKTEGGSYAAAWPDFPAKFVAIKAEPVFPVPADLRFIGRYGSGETSGSALGSSFRLWGVTFTAEGRFQKDERGGYGSNAITSSMPGGVAVNTGYDDEGSFVGASGESFALSNSTKKRPKNNRSGSYSVNGYTMTLKLEDGGTIRLPFFFTEKNRKSIWFEGAVLSKDDDKK